MDNTPLRLRVRDLPIQGRETVELSASLVTAEQFLQNDGNRVIAVANHGRLIGTLSRADLDSFHRTQRDAQPGMTGAVQGVDRVMNVRVVLCDPDESVDEVMRRCDLVNARYVLSVDQKNGLHGIISRDDLEYTIHNVHANTEPAGEPPSS